MSLRHISIKKMRVFVAAVESGSFSIGAKNCHVSQPAAVSIINEIENVAGTELFIRNGKVRSVKLSMNGQEVYDKLVRALALYNDTLECICSLSNGCKEQQFLIQPPYSELISTKWIRAFNETFPDVDLSIHEAQWQDIHNELQSKRSCIALIEGTDRLGNLDYISLCASELVLVNYNAEGSGNLEMEWSALPNNTIVYSATSPKIQYQIKQNLEAVGKNSNQFRRTNSVGIAARLCKEFRVPLLLPRLIADNMQKTMPSIQIVPFSSGKVHLCLGLAAPHGYRQKFESIGQLLNTRH